MRCRCGPIRKVRFVNCAPNRAERDSLPQAARRAAPEGAGNWRWQLARVREQRDILKKRWAFDRGLRRAPAGCTACSLSRSARFRGTVEERYGQIEAMSGEHIIVSLCAALGVTPAGYHAWQRAEPGRRERADAELAVQIAAVHREHRGRYGAPRIQRELSERGLRHSRKRIARLMRERGLGGRVARRWVPSTTESNHSEPIAPNRLAQRAPHRALGIQCG